uniref:hypothetical protein n=1 Tax=Hyphomonas pacifica TaxID=1280941 RepID=UPI002D765A6C|nr:hypothetical protein [Hyphomonas pacifica]
MTLLDGLDVRQQVCICEKDILVFEPGFQLQADVFALARVDPIAQRIGFRLTVKAIHDRLNSSSLIGLCFELKFHAFPALK